MGQLDQGVHLVFSVSARMKNIVSCILLALPCLLANVVQAQFEWKASNDSGYFQPNSTGLKLQNGFERVFIQPYGENGIRVRASIMRDPTGSEPSALLDPPVEGPGGSAGLSFDTLVPFHGNASLRNGNILASLSEGVLSFYRISTSPTNNSEVLTLLTQEYTDDKTLTARFYRQDFRANSFAAEFSFSSDPDEMFFGAGQQACCKDNTVNKKGQVVDLLNFNSQVTLPVYMSNKGYLQFFNMPSQGRIEFTPYRTRYFADQATVVDYYITTAEPGDYDALQKQYTSVTGRQPTPPDFILGYQQSKLRYWNETQVLDVAQMFHDEQVNVSLIVVDFFAWKFQGDWSFDPEFFPDPAGMAAKVKELTGAEMMVSLWPSVEDLSVNYIEMQQEGLLATTRDGTGITDSFAGVYTRLIDSTNPAAREFLWKRLNDSYFSNGIHNFWIDQADGGSLGEPFVNNGQDMINSLPYARTFTQYFLGTQEGSGKMYPWLHQQAIDEGFSNLTTSYDVGRATSCEFMSLTRSTFAGGQRFCSYMWSGDTISRFDVMLQQVTAGVSAGASGISSWTLDIGGFSGLNISTDFGKELFVKWLSMGVFLPYMRVHGDRDCTIPPNTVPSFANNCPNEPWAYGEENFEIIKGYISLRYTLIPYVKRLFQMLQSSGKTIVRALYYDFSSDEMVMNGTASNNPAIVHQYMFVDKWDEGPRLLISPNGVQGATSKDVYLPRLTDDMIRQNFTWTHWWTDKSFGQGGQTINISAPLDQIPVFYLGSKEDILAGNI
ncbi:glycoside hydrolase family 31 protein [Fomitiporia mediterranea MF3/22]|uniref:glycoside hydrolase family 31 protein n=1 Tax=Fomitiporia mediterranea (strain MF3/22) TaxID=694068 RepID=UPI0004407797|nr:glycoside hydrolase family 31 protein [Fomitiporia mediterranea MF3/22]EJD07261.1 glycoside hydrolase family 31 protein [Fomitiporia mediterranea MF3/22]